MRKIFIAVVAILVGLAFIIPIYIPQEIPYLTKLQLILTALITLLVPFILLCLIFSAWVTRHLHIQLERMNIGGINLLFHKPDKIFLNSAKTFLETKRTLYKIDKEQDNFNETLDSYFATYQFFKQEMAILDITKREQKKLYDLSLKIISQLNLFLTAYQSNYRRWYSNTIEENRVVILKKEGEEDELNKKPHMMRIGELQRYYYDYDEILKGFESINVFFRKEVNSVIEVDIKKWERE
ncbi:hypothetical protein [Oceanobacillus picturae]|uniref:hypothetical protein n=1 Tax=Oceanobacillus picturae TaxID=171693 RepID=UPI000E68C031|nr:hypothetical protein [Oceanobacillus picturae]RIU93439.1 hypothetical protein D1864_08210 [Oceanobacillus picturae]